MRHVSLPGRQTFVYQSIVLVMFLVVCYPPAHAQEKLVTPEEANTRLHQLSQAAQVRQGEYAIGSGDLLSIEVFDVTELSREVRVNELGTIALPLLPTRFHAAGLTEIQLEEKLAELLETSGLVSHPQVRVTVKERKSRPITVIGAVGRPMVYQAVRPVTLLEVLSEAGGIANDAGSTVIITRTSPEADTSAAAASSPPTAHNPAAGIATTVGPDSTKPSPPQATSSAGEDSVPAAPALPAVTMVVNLNDLLETGDPKFNIPLQGGDVVSVPRAGIVYVMGAVDHPGGFVLANDRAQMSTLKALALAGGFRRTAKPQNAVILRKDSSTGQQKEVAVDLKRVLERKTEDVRLYPSDILFIPESGGKRAALRMGEIAIALGSGVALFRLAR
jgi:polysaccharide export outer membrane protein